MDLDERLRSSLRPSPARTPGIALRMVGGPSPHPVAFFIFQDVFEELAFASTYRPEPCVAVLTGGFGLDEGRGFVEVTGFTGLTYLDEAQQDPETIDAGAEAESAFDGLYDVLRPVCDEWISEQAGGSDAVVGLFVGAPGSGAALDREVVRAHLSLFNVPFEPVLVVDPVERQVALYARPPGGRFFDSPFALAAPEGQPEAQTLAAEGDDASEEEGGDDADPT